MDLTEQISAAKYLLKKDKSLVSVVFLESDEGIGILPVDKFLNDHHTKTILFHGILPRLIQIQKVHEMLFITEVWYSEKRSLEDAKGVLPSDDPDRKEAINISHITPFGTTTVIIPFERKNDEIIFGDQKTSVDYDNMKQILLEPCIKLIEEGKSDDEEKSG